MATMVSSLRQQAHHIDSFDGIRGVAILLVLIMHAGWFDTGWVGADLFFVLSGFLITRILRKSRSEPFYWRRFYIKRATRILPPLLLGIAVAAVFWPHISPIAIAGYAVSLGNVVNITHLSGWPLRHLWSPSVEEHYYFLWPFVVLWLPRRKLQRVLLAIVVIVPVRRFVFTYLLPGQDPNTIYFLTPFRIDGIALGSLLALLLEQRSWQERLTKWSGAGTVLASVVYLDLRAILGHDRFYPMAADPIFNLTGYSVVAVIAFFVVAYACLRPEAIPTRILRNRLLTKLGVISYGVYVYSWILHGLMEHYFAALSAFNLGLIHILVILPVSAVLFKYYEQPISNWGRRMAAQPTEKANVAKKDSGSDTKTSSHNQMGGGSPRIYARGGAL
jgi:peptidoglycan/LPS O-acetylase OafA/YrhL